MGIFLNYIVSNMRSKQSTWRPQGIFMLLSCVPINDLRKENYVRLFPQLNLQHFKRQIKISLCVFIIYSPRMFILFTITFHHFSPAQKIRGSNCDLRTTAFSPKSIFATTTTLFKRPQRYYSIAKDTSLNLITNSTN